MPLRHAYGPVVGRRSPEDDSRARRPASRGSPNALVGREVGPVASCGGRARVPGGTSAPSGHLGGVAGFRSFTFTGMPRAHPRDPVHRLAARGRERLTAHVRREA